MKNNNSNVIFKGWGNFELQNITPYTQQIQQQLLDTLISLQDTKYRINVNCDDMQYIIDSEKNNIIERFNH